MIELYEKPEITIRMNPSYVPDTRSFSWQPSRYYNPLSSGQLQYLLSGFLSLQLEFQNFLASSGYGGVIIPSCNFHEMFKAEQYAPGLVNAIARSNNSAQLEQILEDYLTSTATVTETATKASIFQRAFPEHEYFQVTCIYRMS